MDVLNLEFVQTHDPRFLLAGAVSLVVVLLTLYGGGWRVLAYLVIGIVWLVVWVVLKVGMVLAVVEYYWAFLGPPETRFESLIWALIITAIEIVSFAIGKLLLPDHPVAAGHEASVSPVARTSSAHPHRGRNP